MRYFFAVALLGCGPVHDVQSDAFELRETKTACVTAPSVWPDGTDCSGAAITVQQVDADTFVLRQSLCTHFEAPFMYLLFGNDRAVLEDTGTGNADVATVVNGIVADWLKAHGKEKIELVVINSHEHGDHTGGNYQFRGKPNTTLVEPGVSSLKAYFKITDWPTQGATLDLGGRVLDVVPIPGHSNASVAFYDPHTRWLLTGDSLYPGRLYVRDFAAYKASMTRLWARYSDKGVCNVMGTHIEMTTTPGEDFGDAVRTHPSEHALALDAKVLAELSEAVSAMDAPALQTHDDFIIYPL